MKLLKCVLAIIFVGSLIINSNCLYAGRISFGFGYCGGPVAYAPVAYAPVPYAPCYSSYPYPVYYPTPYYPEYYVYDYYPAYPAYPVYYRQVYSPSYIVGFSGCGGRHCCYRHHHCH